jgi:hypothetical protein
MVLIQQSAGVACVCTAAKRAAWLVRLEVGEGEKGEGRENAMKAQRCWMLPVVLLLVTSLLDGAEKPQPVVNTPVQVADEQRTEAEDGLETAIAEIEKLGGKSYVDGTGSVICVNLFKTQISDDSLRHLRNLTTLKKLFLGKTQVTGAGIGNLTKLTKLERLWLDDTQVTDDDLAHLQVLTGLKELYLCDTQVTGEGAKHLTNLSRLAVLDLRSTKATDKGLAHVASLANLEGLILAETEVTDAGLEHVKSLRNLECLNLGDTRITDAGLEQLKSLRNLKWLKLGDIHGAQVIFPRSQVTDEGVEKLREALPDCEIWHRHP